MSLPWKVEVNFAGDFFTDSKWVDITGYVMKAQVKRGRSHELDRVEAGTAKFTLKDDDRRFDPTNPDSPYQPDLAPARPIRFSWVDEQGGREWLFHGLTRGWPTNWRNPRYADVELACTDDYRQLAAQGAQIYRFATDPADDEPEPFMQGSGLRISRLLDVAGWPESRRDLDDGQARIWVDPDPEGRPAILAGIEECVTAEAGPLFLAPNGDVVFHNRHRRLLPDDAVQVTFGLPDGLPCWVTPDTDDSELRNRITTQSEAHDDYSVQDDASADRYYRATYEQSAPWWHKAEQIDRAFWLKDRFGEPETRIVKLIWNPAAHPNQQPLAARLDVGDRVVVVVAPDEGEEFRRDCHIESVEHRMPDGKQWTVTYRLSPADERYYFTLGDDTYASLGETTILAH